ncbi:unnamed protein product, partial [Rotaria magnacalcarata]
MDNLRRVEHKKSRISSSRIEPISPDVVYTSGARVFPVERSDLLRSDRWKSSSGQVYENRHHLDSSPALNQGDYYTPAFPLNRPSSSSIRAERSQKAAWIWTCGICIVLFLVLSIVIPLVLSIMGVSTGASTVSTTTTVRSGINTATSTPSITTSTNTTATTTAITSITTTTTTTTTITTTALPLTSTTTTTTTTTTSTSTTTTTTTTKTTTTT